MPVGNVRVRSNPNMVIGKATPQTLGAAALRLATKGGLGKNVKAAQKQTDTADQRYARAMENMKSGGRKSGKTAAVATAKPKKSVRVAQK